MYSRRVPHNLSPNLLSRELSAKRERGEVVFDLTISNPTQALIDYPRDLLSALLHPMALRYEAAPLGFDRTPLERLWAKRGFAVDSSRIALTASTSEAYSALFKVFCDPGDEVLVPRPSYPLLDHLAALECVTVRGYRLVYDGAWSMDLESVRRAVTPKTRAICLVSPNNPTGNYLKRHELEALLAFGLPIISDEVFFEYPLEARHNGPFASQPGAVGDQEPVTVVGQERGLLVSLDGLSKARGLPQMKAAWVTAAGEPRLCEELFGRLEFVLDATLSVSTPVQLAFGRWLEEALPIQRAIQARVRNNWRLLGEKLEGSLVTRLHTEGGWSAVLRLPGTVDDEAWAQLLLTQGGVVVQPGYFYDFSETSMVVVSLLTPEVQFGEGVERLVALVEARA